MIHGALGGVDVARVKKSMHRFLRIELFSQLNRVIFAIVRATCKTRLRSSIHLHFQMSNSVNLRKMSTIPNKISLGVQAGVLELVTPSATASQDLRFEPESTSCFGNLTKMQHTIRQQCVVGLPELVGYLGYQCMLAPQMITGKNFWHTRIIDDHWQALLFKLVENAQNIQ